MASSHPMNPLVSVCIPTFNSAKYLKECIDSVLAQTFTDFEIVVVDNHSSDETLSIIQEYAKRDLRFRVICNERNIGAIPNFNRCIEIAQGDWIKFVHSDDLIAPRCLEEMLAVSKRNPEAAMICCRRDFLFEPGIDEETKQFYLKHLSHWSIESLFPNSTSISASDFCKAVPDHYNFNIVGEYIAIMQHRNVFYRFGTFNTHFAGISDIEFSTRVAIHTGLTYIPQTLATTRVHGKSRTSNILDNNRYRHSHLDYLVLLHDFTFHPIYAPLREAARHHHPPLNFRNLLAQGAYQARRIAERSISNFADRNSPLLDDWKNIVDFYPALLILSNWSLLEKIFFHARNKWGKVKQIVGKVIEVFTSKQVRDAAKKLTK